MEIIAYDYMNKTPPVRAMLLLTAIRGALRYLKPALSDDPPFNTRSP